MIERYRAHSPVYGYQITRHRHDRDAACTQDVVLDYVFNRSTFAVRATIDGPILGEIECTDDGFRPVTPEDLGTFDYKRSAVEALVDYLDRPVNLTKSSPTTFVV